MSEAGTRLDVWLTRARYFKTRNLSATFITKGRVRIERNGQIFRARKPHAEVHIGDRLTFSYGDKLIHMEILALGEKRGSAKYAHTLYKTCLKPLCGIGTISRLGG